MTPESDTAMAQERTKYTFNVEPVSYTHLDVYKRQTPFSKVATAERQAKKKFDTSWLAHLDNSLIAGTTKERSPITAILVSTWDVSPSAKSCLLYTSRCV